MAEAIVMAPERTKGKGSGGVVEYSQPYSVEVEIEGTEALLMHRYDIEAVEAKGKAKKGSRDKKTDNVESYAYRSENGNLYLPGVAVKECIAESAKFTQDPRSPRKSAYDLFRAGIKIKQEIPFLTHTDKWDYEDKRPVVVQMNRVARVRPALREGWRAMFHISILLPEYIEPKFLSEILSRAGMTIGLLDYRPDFGTFRVNRFEALEP